MSRFFVRLSGGVLAAGLLLALAASAVAAPAPSAPPAPAAVSTPTDVWPRQFVSPKGNTVVVYQPQLETFKGNAVTGQAALSVTKAGETVPVFGVVFFAATVSVDREADHVSVLDVKVDRVRFPKITPEQEQAFAAVLQQEIPKWQLGSSYERFIENLKIAEQERKSAEGIRNEPPKILFATEPTVLVLLDGQPQLRNVEGAPLKVVVNTPFLIILDPRSNQFYLAGGRRWWYRATDVLGPWQPIGGPPTEIAAFAAARQRAAPAGGGAQREGQGQGEGQGQVQNAALADDGTGQAQPPKVVVATEPTEIVVAEGKPSFKPLPGPDLLYMNNSESDVLLDITTQDYYVLLEGRWFKTKSLADGPWEYVPPRALPLRFAKIPPDSEVGSVLASVPGTDQAEDAVLDAQMPTTAAVRRSEVHFEVTYDGAPQFIDIEGTSTAYAANASVSVLEIRGRYYACENAVWYVSDSATGPWAVADSVPRADIDQIPPSAPVYNLRYVSIYDSTPDVVYVGYTPGYTGWYPWYGTVVWGTGWYYRPWIGPVYYWGWPWTWGFCMRWNPWTGWGVGTSWELPFIDVAFGWGGWFRPIGWGLWHSWGGGWHRGWWGPGGYRPPLNVVGRAWRTRPGLGRGVPGSGPPHAVRAGVGFRAPAAAVRSDLLRRNLYNRLPAGTRVLPRQAAQPPRTTGGRANDVFAGRDGEVFRRTPSGQWQQHNGQTWRPMPQAPPVQRPELDRAFGARQRGATRSGGGGGGHGGGGGGGHGGGGHGGGGHH
jgi:hypothetical protein